MSVSKEPTTLTMSDFFSASESRLDQWRNLNHVAQSLANTTDSKEKETLLIKAQSIFNELLPIEDYFAYPGTELLSALNGFLEKKDSVSSSRLVANISGALLSNSFRHNPKAWDLHHEAESIIKDAVAIGDEAYKPYFELLIVSASDRATWPDLITETRRLRRKEDEFIYEPVVVGSYEDAVLATVLNGNLQAVVMNDGFVFQSRHALPQLRARLTDSLKKKAGQDQANLTANLSKAIKNFRPELDIFLVTDRDVEKIAGSDDSAAITRVFYGVEEMMEVHLSVLKGIDNRYRTPFFDNLKRYAARPVGTFHALPIARGKSIFKSNWIRDMGEFYGANLFLAESSATTGGLDSLLEPTGNIKIAQEKAARAFGADKSFFATNGTSTSNKIVHQALLAPGDIVLIDRDCHKSHHYAMVLAGAQPYYIDAFTLKQYSMYGSVPIRRIKEALLKLKAEGKLDKAKMLVLTNCTFDGHLANVKQTMEECLAIKSDLIFLFDEAWSGFAHFSPFLRPRTAMGGVQYLREMFKDEDYRAHCKAARSEVGPIELKNPKALDSRLYPDPDNTKLRVYQTNSIHKSMSCLRQGSIILVADEEFASVEEQFHEAFFTHTSTSPNLQIIASIDVARRQMELEGYELVQKAIQLSIELRREINSHPLISKYFKALTPADMIPEEYRATKIAEYGTPEGNWAKATEAIQKDEFFLDPTRITLLCGTAGFDGTQFKGILANEYDIQINKTSRNSVLVQININNTRSDLANIIKVLLEISRKVESNLSSGGDEAKKVFAERVKSLIHDTPDLPDFSAFHDTLRDNPKSMSPEGHMRAAYYLAYDAKSCEHVKLFSKELDERLEKGPELVSANFVIPYPPGFPIMVPGQVITKEIATFMRKLDVKEIHGYVAAEGLKVIKPEALAKLTRNISR